MSKRKSDGNCNLLDKEIETKSIRKEIYENEKPNITSDSSNNIIKSLFEILKIFKSRPFTTIDEQASSYSQKIRNYLETISDQKMQVAVALDHKYTCLSFDNVEIKNALKDGDKYYFEMIYNANNLLPREKQFEFYIARAIDFTEFFDCGHEFHTYKNSVNNKDDYGENYKYWSKSNSYKSIEPWFDVNGTLRFLGCDEIDRNEEYGNEISLDFLRNIIDIYNNSYGDNLYFGNNPKTKVFYDNDLLKTKVYERFVLVFWPRICEYQMVLDMNIDIAIEYLSSELESYSEDELYLRKECEEHLNLLIEKLKRKDERYSSNRKRGENVISIFEEIENLELFKVFLNEIELDYMPIDLSYVIKSLRWDNLKDELVKRFKPLKFQDAINNCSLVKKLYELKEEQTAFDCFNSTIYAFLLAKNQEYNCSKDVCDLDYDKRTIVSFCCNLAETIFLFYEKDINEICENFVSFIEKFNQNEQIYQDILFKLVSIFIKSEKYTRSKHILKLIKQRVVWLENKISKESKLNWWYMTGGILNHSDLDKFFASEKEEIKYSDHFKSLPDARNFASDNNGLKQGYSANMRADGRGDSAFVVIKKTKDFHEKRLKIIETYQCEFNNIKDKARFEDLNP